MWQRWTSQQRVPATRSQTGIRQAVCRRSTTLVCTVPERPPAVSAQASAPEALQRPLGVIWQPALRQAVFRERRGAARTHTHTAISEETVEITPQSSEDIRDAMIPASRSLASFTPW